MHLYSSKRARRSLFDTAFYRTISQAATMLGYVVMVRGMTEQAFGVFNLLYAVVPVMSALASFGVDNVLQRYQPEYIASRQYTTAAWLVRFISRARLGANLVVLTFVLAAWHMIMPTFKLDPYRAEFLAFSGITLLFFQIRVLDVSLASHMLHKYSVGGYAILAVIKLVGYVFFTLTHRLTLQTAIATDTVASALAFAFMYLAHRRFCELPPGTFPEPPSREEKKRLLRYGLFYNFNDVGTLALSSGVANFFVAAFMDTARVGTFSFYTRLSGMVDKALPTSLFQNVIRPVFFATPRADAPVKIPKYFTLLINMSLLLTAPITAYAAIYHREIVDVVFGGKFREDSLLLPMVLAFVTIKIVSTPVALAAQYEEKALTVLLSKVFGLVSLAGMFLLIPILGVYGAALATGGSDFLKELFIWWSTRRTARWTNFGPAMASTAVCWGGFYVACSVLKSHLTVAPLVHLVIGAALCLAVAAVYARTPVLCASDRAILGSVLKGKESRWLKLVGLVT
ncbi:MAG: oligosaccharide flippase family protein [Gammaproteobacteria bacterium]